MDIYNALHALAEQIDSDVEEIRKAASDAGRQHTRTPIAGGLGTVTVQGGGQLVSVEIDRRGVGGTNGASLGRQVVLAIREAEAQAKSATQEQINAAKPPPGHYA